MDPVDAQRRATTVRRGPAKIAIVDDHALVLEGLAFAIRNQAGHEIVAAFSDIESLIDWCRGRPIALLPDLLLLDLMLSGDLVDSDRVAEIVELGIRVLIVSGTSDGPLIRELLSLGVIGYVAKEDSTRQLFAGIEAALGGQPWTSPQLADIVARDPNRPALSDRELEAVQLYASGLKMVSVAREMGIAYETARQYIDRARQKYAEVGREVRTKTEIYQAAVDDRLIRPSSLTTHKDPHIAATLSTQRRHPR